MPYHTSALHEQPTPLTWASVQSPSQLPTWVIWGSLCLTPQPESIDSVAYLPPKYIQAPRRQGLVYSTLYPHVLTQLLSCRETQNVSAEQRLELGLSVDKRMCAKRQECKGLRQLETGDLLLWWFTSNFCLGGWEVCSYFCCLFNFLISSSREEKNCT